MEKFQFDEKVNKIGVMSGTSEEVLKKMSRLLYDAGYVKNTYPSAIITREKTFPTGLPFEKCGIALPHTDCRHVNKPMISVCTLRKPVIFQNMGDKNKTVAVKIVFMLAMNKSENQLKLLSELITNLQDETLIENLLQADSPKNLTTLLSEKIKI